ncbi:MAG: alpha-glucosidase family protein [Rhizobiaceae bacterium]
MTRLTGKNAEWWRGATLYQIYPRSFQDTNADGIGDLSGIRQRLDEVKSLGVDGIWVSPFFTSPMKDFGYDVSGYKDVDPMFGTLEDFDALVTDAHARGIKVVIDLVLSHTADVHPWFKQSRSSRDNDKADWFVWAEPKDDGTPPNNWLSVFGGSSWEWDSRRRQYYLHNFLTSQPDLNFHCADVQDAMLDVARFWLERGVDGFRLDTVNYYFHDRHLRSNPPASASGANTVPAVNPYGRQKHDFDKTQPENIDFLRRFRSLLNEYDAFAVGEVGDEERSVQTMADYTSGPDMLQMCYSFELLGPQFNPEHIRNTVDSFFKVATDGWPCWAFSNHDVERHVTRWAGAQSQGDTAKFCIALIGALRGSLCLYQGEELGLTEASLTYEQLQDPYGIRFWPDFKGRDGCRTPYPWDGNQPNGGFTEGVPWLPVSNEHLAHGYVQQMDDAGSVMSAYRNVLAARKAAPVLLSGEQEFIECTDQILSFERSNDNEKRYCVYNFSHVDVTVEVPSAYEAAMVVDAFTTKATVNGGRLTLGALGCAMLIRAV